MRVRRFMIFGGKLADGVQQKKDLVLLRLRFFSMLQRNMIGAPDVLVSTESVLTQRTHQLAVGKENIGASANKSLAAIRTQEKALSDSMQQVPGIGLRVAERLNPSSGKLLIVEGNIGVGKTTLTKKIARELNYKLFLEPATENPFLEKFYADPHKYALKLQLWILNQRYLTYVAAVKHILETGEGAVLDRSVYSDSVFASVCTQEGFISNEGYEQYLYWRRRSLEHLPLPHVTIFLDASPQCCYERIHTRARDCEKSGVTLDYLQKLHKEYLKFLQVMRAEGSVVLQFDWSTFKSTTTVTSIVHAARVAEWREQELPVNGTLVEIPLVEEA